MAFGKKGLSLCKNGFHKEEILSNFSLRKFWQLQATFKKIWSNLRLRLPLGPGYTTRATLILELDLPVFYRFAKSVMEPALICFFLFVCVCVCFFAVFRQNSRVPIFNSSMIIHPCTKDSLKIIENMNDN